MSEACSAESCACSSRLARSAAAAASAAGTFSNPAARSSTRSSPGNGLRHRAALSHQEDADPGRPAPLVRGGGRGRPAARQRKPAGGRAGVHEHGGVHRLRHLADGLHHSDLGVGGLDRDDCRHPVGSSGSGDAAGGDPAPGINLDRLEATAAGRVPGAGVQYGRVLHAGGEQQVTLPGPAGEQPEHPQVHGMRAARRERHLIGAHLEAFRHHGAGVVEHQPGLASGLVQATRVGVPAVQGPFQDLPRCGVQRLPRGVVQVRIPGIAHRAKPTRALRGVRRPVSSRVSVVRSWSDVPRQLEERARP